MDTPEEIISEINSLAPSAVIELFEVDTTSFGGDILRFHAGTNGLNQNLIWQGEEFIRYPVEATGFDLTGQGQNPRPTLRVSNYLSTITAILIAYGDLVGCKVTRKRTLKKYLDAVNFSGGNPTADPEGAFVDDIFFIDRKALETREVVEFELASALDLSGILLPRRQIIQNLCTWRYRGGECGYAGDDYFDTRDNPVDTLGEDKCGKRLSSCKKRFGENAELPFGGFPGAGLFR